MAPKKSLTAKQKLVAEDIVEKIKKGEKPDAVGSTEKFYNVGSKNSARVITSQNFAKPEFRKYLIDGLHEKGIVGPNSKVENRLEEGLDATSIIKGGDLAIDYRTRLAYVQEINKILGVYAPTQVEKKTLNLTLDVSEEELDEKIRKLNKELDS